MSDRTVLRTVFPGPGRMELLPLYVAQDAGSATGALVDGRSRLRVPALGTASLQSYFNAFPAGYWQHATPLSRVLLEVRSSGTGTVTVSRSDGDGAATVVERRTVDGEAARTVFDLPLEGFDTGGWYWIDLEAGADGLTLESADWSAAEDSDAPRSMSVVITTYNRPDSCVELLDALASEARVVSSIDRIFLVDQGTSKVADAAGYGEVAAAHGGRLVPIDQPNLGGSGGFSRGMVELLRRQESGYLMLLDDDIALEPEGALRALQFARYATEPTIVGGHMFDFNHPLTLHAFGEVVDRRTFNWGPPDPDHTRHDFTAAGLGETPWLHRRHEVDFNGWWMCLIPRPILEELGLSMPYFIKWDDAEYGLRALSRGHRTVSLPGAAVWHVSWLDKDDSRDWQSFFHSRNRLVSALIHSPTRRGGTLVVESLGLDLKHLLFMQYYAVRLRQEAIRDVLAGPSTLEGALRTRLPWTRSVAAEYGEMRVIRSDADLEGGRSRELSATEPRPSKLGLIAWLVKTVTRHFLPVARRADRTPVRLTRSAARWWRVPRYDDVLVPLADGTGSALYRRDPKRFRSELRSSVLLHLRLILRWRRLRRDYRAAAGSLFSVAAWERYLGLDASSADGVAIPAAASSRDIRSS
ncbi:glycosyltransferase [Lysobacter korlensis]|uniref:Glycosyltransferase n=1 Tax=Lysobacter korlensis TaxID=553636 RepID=A0ABV6RYK0_9GAMM